jgi:hypothetical protein
MPDNLVNNFLIKKFGSSRIREGHIAQNKVDLLSLPNFTTLAFSPSEQGA